MTELSIKLYQKMYLIRKTEEKIREHYMEDEMKTPMHMSMGEEAIAVGVCHALKTEDQVFGTYRSHAIYLAKTQKIGDFFAEMYGKDTALLKGKGGSMHMCAPESGFMGTSAIVASIIPVAVGAAFANKRKGNGKIVAVFFGDGATDEGAFWESLNVACLMKLPVLFVCEDNGFAVHTATSKRQGYVSITDIVSKFNCNVLKENTTDAEIIYKLTHQAIKLIRKRLIDPHTRQKQKKILDNIQIDGFPLDLASARELAENVDKGRIHFQDWIIEVMLGGVSNPKKTADGGFDGYILFKKCLEDREKQQILIEVKSGKAGVGNIREFIQVVRKREAAIGVFVCFAEHVTGGMEKEARECGYYNEEIFNKRHPEIQILTVDQILKGELVNMPPVLETTFKSAAKARPQHDGEQKKF